MDTSETYRVITRHFSSVKNFIDVFFWRYDHDKDFRDAFNDEVKWIMEGKDGH